METCQQCGRELNIEEVNICFSCKDLESLANKAIAEQYEIVKFTREFVSSIYETKDTVGDWNGLEEHAAKAMNQFYDCIVEAVEFTSANSHIGLSPEIVQIVLGHLRDAWIKDRDLLFMKKENMQQYGLNIFKRFI